MTSTTFTTHHKNHKLHYLMKNSKVTSTQTGLFVTDFPGLKNGSGVGNDKNNAHIPATQLPRTQ